MAVTLQVDTHIIESQFIKFLELIFSQISGSFFVVTTKFPHKKLKIFLGFRFFLHLIHKNSAPTSPWSLNLESVFTISTIFKFPILIFGKVVPSFTTVRRFGCLYKSGDSNLSRSQSLEKADLHALHLTNKVGITA